MASGDFLDTSIRYVTDVLSNLLDMLSAILNCCDAEEDGYPEPWPLLPPVDAEDAAAAEGVEDNEEAPIPWAAATELVDDRDDGDNEDEAAAAAAVAAEEEPCPDTDEAPLEEPPLPSPLLPLSPPLCPEVTSARTTEPATRQINRILSCPREGRWWGRIR